MKSIFTNTLIIIALLVLALPLSAQKLATLKVDAELTNTDGRSLVNARNHHLIIDSPPPLGGGRMKLSTLLRSSYRLWEVAACWYRKK